MFSTSKIGCGAFITVVAKWHGTTAYLEITQMCSDHNHTVNATAYALHPQNHWPEPQAMQSVTELVHKLNKFLDKELAGYSSLFAYVRNENLRTKVLIFCVLVIHHGVRTRIYFYAQSYSIYSNWSCYPFSLTAVSLWAASCILHFPLKIRLIAHVTYGIKLLSC